MKLLRHAVLAIAIAAPLYAQSALDQGRVLFEQRKLAEAKAAFAKAVTASPRDASALFWLGKTELLLEDADASVAHLEKAVALQPAVSEYHFWLGRAYGDQAMRAGKLKQASLARKVKASFEKAVELDPSNLDARVGLVQFYMMAPGIVGGGADKAKAQAAEIAKRDPARGAIQLSRVHRNEKEWGEAERVLAQAINREPSNMELRRELGFFYQQREQWAKAYSTFAAIVSAQPGDLAAHYQIGRTAAMSGSYLDEGEASLRKYLQHEPPADLPPLKWAHVRLGAIYENKRRPDLARAEYQAALKLDPSFKEAKEALAKAG